MPDRRAHRGAHPKDRDLFATSWLPRLRRAALDFSWLLGRDYAVDSALKLVGDHFQLALRQRAALKRVCCSEEQARRRRLKRRNIETLAGQNITLDGFNCLITIEAALSGGLVLVAQDGAHRDLASVHGTYKQVTETEPALELACETLHRAQPADVIWYLDSPVSNSGRLARLLRTVFVQRGLSWQVELVKNADREVVGQDCVAASSDAWVIDMSQAWFDLPGAIIERRLDKTWLLDFTGSALDG